MNAMVSDNHASCAPDPPRAVSQCEGHLEREQSVPAGLG